MPEANVNRLFEQLGTGRSPFEWFYEDLPAHLNMIPTYRCKFLFSFWDVVLGFCYWTFLLMVTLAMQRFYQSTVFLGFHAIADKTGAGYLLDDPLGNSYRMGQYRGFNWRDY
jgi:hypothetical protein